MSQHREGSRKRPRAPGPHGARPQEVRRPGPHGAPARSDTEEEAIARAYRRAERSSRRVFQEVSPRRVIAAEAATSLNNDDDLKKVPNSKKRLLRSPACFIATAAYGDRDAPEVKQLRRFRDQVLLQSRVGTAIVRLYYSVSPPVARLIARRPRLRVAARRALDLFRFGAA
ncbi:MAG: hypothetical protein OER88_14840 [Planctomycetota bacterium]|nr:hypothetical protein [Planctomycetota bacterium]